MIERDELRSIVCLHCAYIMIVAEIVFVTEIFLMFLIKTTWNSMEAPGNVAGYLVNNVMTVWVGPMPAVTSSLDLLRLDRVRFETLEDGISHQYRVEQSSMSIYQH